MNLHRGVLGLVVVMGAEAALAVVFSGGVGVLPGDTARGLVEAGTAALTVAGLCFVACAAVLYGIYRIVPQFHR